jgi:hypothetical protein
MHNINKKLAATAAAGALMAVIGTAWSQTDAQVDPNATPASTESATGARILFFKDQGNSPESDPAAHLILIKDEAVQPIPVATSSTTTTTTVEQTTTVPADTAPAPPVTDSSNMSTTTDSTTAAPMDTPPVLAPRADRN